MTYTGNGNRNALRAFKVHIVNARSCVESAKRFVIAAADSARNAAMSDVEQSALGSLGSFDGALALLSELMVLAGPAQKGRRR